MFPHNDEGRAELLSTYETDPLQEIASHGCESGVCHKHIYYVDTISFFDKYEGEILDLIQERYGVDTLVEIFKRSDACYDMYRNECCWLFIENVAADVVIEMEESQLAEDQQIENYMQQSISNNGYTLDELNKAADYTLADELAETAKDIMNLSVYNAPKSMTLNRYSLS